jgi:hypothetical protein
MKGNTTWKGLLKTGTESLIYLSFYKPKTQKEATEFIYGKGQKVNLAPIINARRKLLNAGYLEVNTQGLLRNIPIKSVPTPVVEYVSDVLERRQFYSKTKVTGKLTNDQEKALYMILDSEWFRDLFSVDLTTVSHGFYRENEKIILKSNALKIIAETLTEICLMAEHMHHLGYRQPILKDLIKAEDFDSLVKGWYEKRLKDDDQFNETVVKFKEKVRELHPSLTELVKYKEAFLKSIYLFCIPHEVSKDVLKAERTSSFARDIDGIVNGMLMEKGFKPWEIT